MCIGVRLMSFNLNTYKSIYRFCLSSYSSQTLVFTNTLFDFVTIIVLVSRIDILSILFRNHTGAACHHIIHNNICYLLHNKVLHFIEVYWALLQAFHSFVLFTFECDTVGEEGAESNGRREWFAHHYAVERGCNAASRWLAQSRGRVRGSRKPALRVQTVYQTPFGSREVIISPKSQFRNNAIAPGNSRFMKCCVGEKIFFGVYNIYNDVTDFLPMLISRPPRMIFA